MSIQHPGISARRGHGRGMPPRISDDERRNALIIDNILDDPLLFTGRTINEWLIDADGTPIFWSA